MNRLSLFSGFFPGIRFFGGATAENFTLNSTDQFFNSEVLHNAVPYLLFYGPLRYHWAVTEGLGSGWQAIGDRLDAQCEGNWIKTLANKPAIEHLASRYRLEGGLLSVCHPFVIYPYRDSDEHFFRDVTRYSDETGALEAAQLLPADCQIQLTEPDPQAILAVSGKSILRALAHYPGTATPAGVLWFSCASRALVLAHNAASEFKTAINPVSATLPVGGFYCYGEIAPAAATGACTCHSATLVTLLLGEEPGTAIGIINPDKRFSADNQAQAIQTLTLRMVQVWIDLHREELLAGWELAKDGIEPFRIDPLK